jgi:hypothetical protein
MSNLKKICKKCRLDKELKEYNKNKRAKDGYRNECRVCCKLYMKSYYNNNKLKLDEYKKNNREHINKNQREKDTNRECTRLWYEKNKEKRKLYMKNYRKKLKDK